MATQQNILAEEQKSDAFKPTLDFFVSGIQLYDIKTGRIKRFGRRIWKKVESKYRERWLDDLFFWSFSLSLFPQGKNYFFQGEQVNDLCCFPFAALNIFSNSDTQLFRLLLMKFLSTFWSIQTWARSQASLGLHSSSLLLVYDAKRLRTQISCNQNHSNSSTISSRSSSVDSSSKLNPTSSSSMNGKHRTQTQKQSTLTAPLIPPMKR